MLVCIDKYGIRSIDSEIIRLITQWESVKELMDYLDFLYSGRENISRIYGV